MSILSTFTEIGLLDCRTTSGVITLPSSSQIPGRVITYKDLYGNASISSVVLSVSTTDLFEDGTTYKTIQNNWDFITVYAASTNMWSVIGGTQYNYLRANTMSNNYLISSNISTLFTNTQYLFPPAAVPFIYASNLSPYTTTSQLGGSLTSNFWFQAFIQSTITSNLVAPSVVASANINVGNTLLPAYSTIRFSTINLGNVANRFFQGFFFSTITSTINADTAFGTSLSYQNISTQNITGFSLLGTTILSTQQIFCSSIQVGAGDSILDVIGPIRAQDMSTLTLQASTITSGTMTLDRLFGGPIATATTTGNIYPFSAGALVGFGSNTAQGGTYAEGHFRSTFTQVIQPTLDAGAFSNIVYINGNISTPNIFVSSIAANTITASTIFTSTLSSQNVFTSNVYGLTGYFNTITVNTSSRLSVPFVIPAVGDSYELGSAQNRWLRTFTMSTVTSVITPMVSITVPNPGIFDINSTIRMLGTVSTQNQVVSSITMNTGVGTTLSMSTVTTNALTIGAGAGFVNIPFIQSVLTSSIQVNTSVLNTSTINAKLPPFWSTLNIPTSSFSITGTNAGTPIVLYSNVDFPPYTKGLYKLYQKAILTKVTGGAGVDARASIFYTQGTYPSTTTFLDGFSILPYTNTTSISTYTTCVTTCTISSITTRNICYYDGSANAYTASLFMGNLAVEYTPSLGVTGDIGQFQ